MKQEVRNMEAYDDGHKLTEHTAEIRLDASVLAVYSINSNCLETLWLHALW